MVIKKGDGFAGTHLATDGLAALPLITKRPTAEIEGVGGGVENGDRFMAPVVAERVDRAEMMVAKWVGESSGTTAQALMLPVSGMDSSGTAGAPAIGRARSPAVCYHFGSCGSGARHCQA